MTTTTFGLATSYPAAAAKPAKGLFGRFYTALIEARTRQAMREIAMHRHLVPDNVLKNAGYEPTLTKDGSLPFTR